MRAKIQLLLISSLCGLASGCVDPIADFWLLTDVASSPSGYPEGCTRWSFVDGYLDVSEDLEGGFDFSGLCSGSYSSSAAIVRIGVAGDNSYTLSLQYSSGDQPAFDYSCVIDGKEMQCTWTSDSGNFRTYMFERGAWFNNSPD